MNPSLLASTVTPPMSAVVTMLALAAAGLLLAAVGAEEEVALLLAELQPTSIDAAAAAADNPSSTRRRAGPVLRRDTAPSPRSGVLRISMIASSRFEVGTSAGSAQIVRRKYEFKRLPIRSHQGRPPPAPLDFRLVAACMAGQRRNREAGQLPRRPPGLATRVECRLC